MGRNAVCTANPAGGIQRDEVCKRGGKALWGLYRRACLAQEKLAICGRLQNLEHSWQTALFRRAAILASGRECRTPSLVASLECKTAKAVWSKDTCWDGKGNECAVWQHSAGTGFRRNNRIVGRQFDRAIRSQSCKVCKNLAGTDFIQNTVGVGKWIGQKVAGTQLGGFVGNMGQKAMGFGQGLLGGAKTLQERQLAA